MRNLSALCASLMTGCLTSTVNEIHEDVALEGDITDVVVAVPSGDLTVEVAAIATPELSRTVRWTGADPDVAAFWEGSVLHLEVDCRSFQLTCQVDQVLRLPAAAGLTAELGTGTIVASGLDGVVDVHTGDGHVKLSAVDGVILASSGNGGIEVQNVTGTLSIDTGTGDLVVRDADVSELVATSGSGSVNLAMLSVPERITVDTGAGDVWVAVPFGTYRIDARTGAGQVSISGLTADEGATSVLDLETGRGDIVVEGID